jgi:hypothetical protein
MAPRTSMKVCGSVTFGFDGIPGRRAHSILPLIQRSARPGGVQLPWPEDPENKVRGGFQAARRGGRVLSRFFLHTARVALIDQREACNGRHTIHHYKRRFDELVDQLGAGGLKEMFQRGC